MLEELPPFLKVVVVATAVGRGLLPPSPVLSVVEGGDGPDFSLD